MFIEWLNQKWLARIGLIQNSSITVKTSVQLLHQVSCIFISNYNLFFDRILYIEFVVFQIALEVIFCPIFIMISVGTKERIH